VRGGDQGGREEEAGGERGTTQGIVGINQVAEGAGKASITTDQKVKLD
jgi:hypothetical protein